MPKGAYANVVGFALSHPWAVLPEMLSVIAGILAQHIAGEDVNQSALEAALVNRKNLPQPRAGSVAVIPIYGVIAPRINMMSDMSGGTTFEKLTGQLHEAMANASVKTVVFDVDSPGGNVAGATEFARDVMKARTKKPIIAQIQYTGASAAYWPMAAATEIVAAPSAQIGSIGIYTAHDNLAKALAERGIEREYIFAGEGKTDAKETGPLSDEGRARIKATVEAAYAQFVGDVIKGRGQGVTEAKVRKEWKAHVYGASDALAIGMIDRVATLDETLARLLSASPDASDQRVALTIQSHGHTLQEPPVEATSQDVRTAADLERQLFEMQLTN